MPPKGLFRHIQVTHATFIRRFIVTMTMTTSICWVSIGHSAMQDDTESWFDGISLQEFVEFIRSHNSALKISQNRIQIADEQVIEAQGIFQPILSVSANASRSLQPLSVDDQALGRTPDPYPSNDQTIEVGLSKLLPTGATLGATSRLTREKTGDIDDYQLRSYLGISLNQPLLKGLGNTVVSADINVAKIGAKISQNEASDNDNIIIAQATTLFLDALRTQMLISNLTERLEVLENLREESLRLIEQGRLPQSARLDIQAAIGQVKTLRLDTLQQLDQFKSDMLSFAGSNLSSPSDIKLNTEIIPANPLSPCSLDTCLKQALLNRADYKSQQLRIEQAGINQLKAEDNLRPELDLVVEVGFSEQTDDVDNSFEISHLQSNPDTLLGLEFRTPLWGDESAKAAARRARMETVNAQIEALDLKLSIENDLKAQIAAVDRSGESWREWESISDSYNEQYMLAINSLSQGRGDIVAVLRASEAKLNAKASWDEAKIAHLQAWVRLQASQGLSSQLALNGRLEGVLTQ